MSREKKFQVYMVRSRISGKSYIGKTIYSIAHRWLSHLAASKLDETALARAIRKYGADSFELNVLYEGFHFISLKHRPRIEVKEAT